MRVSINDAKVAWYLKPFFWHQRKKYGEVLKPALVWAKSPKLFITVASLYGVLDRKKSPLSPILRSLVTVLVSQINSCRFCVDLNSATLIKRTQSEAKCDELPNWRESKLFTEQERAALNYAERMTFSDQGVDNACFTQLRQFFRKMIL